jgi:nicotinamide riboside transporter PnuC
MWSWVLAVIGTTGIFFVGKKNTWAWLVLLLNEMLWVIYATVTHQYGFYLASLGYTLVYIRSYMEWEKAK